MPADSHCAGSLRPAAADGSCAEPAQCLEAEAAVCLEAGSHGNSRAADGCHRCCHDSFAHCCRGAQDSTAHLGRARSGECDDGAKTLNGIQSMQPIQQDDAGCMAVDLDGSGRPAAETDALIQSCTAVVDSASLRSSADHSAVPTTADHSAVTTDTVISIEASERSVTAASLISPAVDDTGEPEVGPDEDALHHNIVAAVEGVSWNAVQQSDYEGSYEGTGDDGMMSETRVWQTMRSDAAIMGHGPLRDCPDDSMAQGKIVGQGKECAKPRTVPLAIGADVHMEEEQRKGAFSAPPAPWLEDAADEGEVLREVLGQLKRNEAEKKERVHQHNEEIAQIKRQLVEQQQLRKEADARAARAEQILAQVRQAREDTDWPAQTAVAHPALISIAADGGAPWFHWL